MAGKIFLDSITGSKLELATEKTPGAVSAQGTSEELSLGALSWTATIAPSGVTSKLYRFSLTGKQMMISWVIKAANPGVLVSSVSAPFPSDLPMPWQFSNQENDEWIALGSGAILTVKNDDPNKGSMAGIYRTSAGALQLRINTGNVSLGAKYARGFVTYITGSE